MSILPEHAVHLEFGAANATTDGVSKLVTGKMGVATINNAINYKVWDVSKNNFAHISTPYSWTLEYRNLDVLVDSGVIFLFK